MSRLGKEHTYRITVRWTGNTGSGTASYRGYGRNHDVSATGRPDRPVIEGSADPAFLGDDDRWSPEDLFVAALSECHMLTYLALCAREGIVVTGYQDTAAGRMEETAGHSGHFTEVLLRPQVTLAPSTAPETMLTAVALHREAHRDCFLANSVNFPVRHEAAVGIGRADIDLSEAPTSTSPSAQPAQARESTSS